MVWSTFYDIRRYGGLQIYLRAVLGGVPLVLSSAGRADRGISGPRRRRGRDAYFRHSLALAPRADERRGAVARAAVCAPVRRGGRPGPPGSAARDLSERQDRPRIRLHGGRGRVRCDRWPGRLSGAIPRCAARRHRDEDRGWHAAHSLPPHGRPVSGFRPRPAVERGWLRRHRRSGGAQGRPLLLSGPPRRRHQRRRHEGLSRGGRRAC